MTDLNLQIADRVRLLEYIQALEHTRADLISAVNEARDKCGALERGNIALQAKLESSEAHGEMRLRNYNILSDNYLKLSEEYTALKWSKVTATVGIEPNP